MKSTLRAGLVALLEAHPKDEEAQEAQDAGTRPRWRSVMLEARDRGVVHADGTPNTRLFRAHLRMWGVRVQGRGKCQLVCPEEIDAALDRRAHAQRASLSTSESQAAQAARSIMERGKR